MSGATGAGSSGTSTGSTAGTETDGGGRGSAASAKDTHTTQLKAIKSPAKGSSSPDTPGSQGGTVTDTRGSQPQQYAAGAGPAAAGAQPQPQPAGAQPASAASASPLPGERQQQAAGPYHPPQAYQTPAPGSAVRRPRTGARTTPRTRKARLRVAKADPWSVMKVSFLLSIALGVCTIVASAVLWMVMDAMGVFSSVGGTISEATGSNESNGFDLQSFLSLPNVLMFTSIIAVIDVVLATALATLGAFIYNLSAGFVGGVELTLAEDE
ncbi:DUF3566 domain-containing protein [Streptomyces ferrugineus]|uniref:DUF3566 domain-containing protein n=1 Tax=Streptomyces ferrugineus TaxID=1413221 RepID=A0A7M2SNP0_9ACTN|nr:DUF3566 domain-containing protein [Streptomyces ferrugineus]QOV37093.1 DUF3566 domain-containing protein [Streptomyces ferrugineus]